MSLWPGRINEWKPGTVRPKWPTIFARCKQWSVIDTAACLHVCDFNYWLYIILLSADVTSVCSHATPVQTACFHSLNEPLPNSLCKHLFSVRFLVVYTMLAACRTRGLVGSAQHCISPRKSRPIYWQYIGFLVAWWTACRWHPGCRSMEL